MKGTIAAINYGNSFDKMNARDKVECLMSKIVENNNELLALLNKMSPEDYNYFLPKVKAVMGIRENEEIPTLARHIENPDDLPEGLFGKLAWEENEEWPNIIN